MCAVIREFQKVDEEAVVHLSLRAWSPNFASTKLVVGEDLFIRLHGDWREYQEQSVRQTLANPAIHVWVGEADRRIVGFVAATLHPERLMGEIWMLAVDPDRQNRNIGTALTDFATDWLRESGMRVAMVETGGDVGHAAARQVYEKANFTLCHVARYFKAL